jgi:hypothetical protein
MKGNALIWLAAASATGAVACGGDAGGSSSETLGQGSSALAPSGHFRAAGSVLPNLPATPTVSASTVPPNGDINPYGVAFVPDDFPPGGALRPGDVIVANFNDAANLQGTGTTIVRVNAGAPPTVFFADAAAPGFSTALAALRRGFVIVGTVPSADGSGACVAGADGQPTNVGQGSLLVIDREGKLVRTLTSPKLLDGPWDLTVEDLGATVHVFVSNVLRGSVTRLDLRVDETVVVERETQIASGYTHRCDPAAFVVGPTGLALDRERDVLYVAATGDDAIFAIADATDTPFDHGRGKLTVDDPVHLHGPLGLARTPDGDLVCAQGDAVNPDANQPSEIVEFTAGGRFVDQFSIDPAPGSAFGLALERRATGLRFAAVDDGLNVLDIWNVR